MSFLASLFLNLFLQLQTLLWVKIRMEAEEGGGHVWLVLSAFSLVVLVLHQTDSLIHNLYIWVLCIICFSLKLIYKHNNYKCHTF